MRRLLARLFFSDLLLAARWEGCKAIEDMVYERIKEHYPSQAQELWENLLQ